MLMLALSPIYIMYSNSAFAVSGTGQLQITTGENICVIWKA
jgi:hypothetical protein